MSLRGVAIVAGVAALAGMANAGMVVANPGQTAPTASLEEWAIITTAESLPQGGLKVTGTITQAEFPAPRTIDQGGAAATNVRFAANPAVVVADGVTVALPITPQVQGVTGLGNSLVAQNAFGEQTIGSGQGGGTVGQGFDSVVPLPTSAGLAGLGLIGLGIRRHRAS